MMEFKEVLSKSFVIINPKAETPQELFHLFGEFLLNKGLIRDGTKFAEDLTAKEKAQPTAIGKGIAIPHIMLPHLDRSYIVIARLKKGIPFDALGGEPVRIVILFLSPPAKKKEYIRNLARIASVLQRENVIEDLLKAENGVSVISIVTVRRGRNFFSKNSRFFYFMGMVLTLFIIFGTVLPKMKIPWNEITAKSGDLKFNESLWVNKQIMASGVFFSTIIGTLLFWRQRVAIASFGLGILLLSGTMDVNTTVKFMSIPTILFIISMMVVIAWLKYLGFFKSIVSNILEKVGPYPRKIFFILMLLSLILGGFCDEVTAILVVSAISIFLCDEMNLNSFPFIIGLIFATNIGSALTLMGNPIGIYIAFAGNLTFEDFLKWATPISLFTVILITLLLLVLFRKQIPEKVKACGMRVNPLEGITEKNKMKWGGIIFLLLILCIAFSKRFDNLLNLLPNTTLVAIPLVFVGLIVFIEREHGKILITEGVDWWTILFFMFLFAKAACLEYTGVTSKLAYQIESFSQRYPLTVLSPQFGPTITSLVVITLFTAIASGFVDNLPIIAALVPVVKHLKIIGVPHAEILWWALLFGGCFGGNLTMIGSSANMVALSVYEKSEGKTIHFMT